MLRQRVREDLNIMLDTKGSDLEEIEGTIQAQTNELKGVKSA